MRLRYLISATSSLLYFSLLPAAAGTAGSAGVQFLKIAQAARPAAMGEAYTAVAGRPECLAWNPAGILRVEGLQECFSHAAWLEGINVEHFALARRINDISSIGTAMEYCAVGDIQRANRCGGILGTYDAYDVLGMVTYARVVGPVDAGVSFKLVREKIENNAATTMAFDLGAQYRVNRLALGLSLQHIGAALQLTKTASTPLPMTIRAGCAYPLKPNLDIMADISLPSDAAAGIHLGGEYRYSGFSAVQLAGRAGFKTGPASAFGMMAGLSAGFGVRWHEWDIDYALAPFGELGMTHRLTVGLRFAQIVTVAPAAPSEPGVQVSSAAAPAPAAMIVPLPADAAQMLQDALRWFAEKTADGRMPQQDQLMLLEKIREKFDAIGVDMTPLNKVQESLSHAP